MMRVNQYSNSAIFQASQRQANIHNSNNTRNFSTALQSNIQGSQETSQQTQQMMPEQNMPGGFSGMQYPGGMGGMRGPVAFGGMQEISEE
ncbi:MAG: hypothetical protein IJQ58_09690 [Synergistaceae bacterium]|nr:hypothetical protein [Synergistaceae bacterium]